MQVVVRLLILGALSGVLGDLQSRKVISSQRSLQAVHGKNRIANPGVNLAGAEFDSGWQFPNHGEVDYFYSKGLTTIRIPVKWERLQPSLNGNLDPSYLGGLQDICIYAASKKGGVCIIDIHNSGLYYNNKIGAAGGPSVAQFQDFWKKMANVPAFKNNLAVWFNLMNEPHAFTTEFVRYFMQAGIDAVRSTGAKNWVIVQGNGYSGSYDWTSIYSFNKYGTPNGNVFGGLIDKGVGRIIIDTHNYFDYFNEGNGLHAVSATVGVERLTRFFAWCKKYKYKAMVGETGAANDAKQYEAWNNQMDFIYKNRDVCISWCWWAAGPIWNQDYWSLIEPYPGGGDRPQMSHIYPYT